MRYELKGEPMPVVICYLEQGEKMINESGSMTWMSPNMQMDTNFNGKGLKGVLGAAFSGESIFKNTYTATNGSGMIAFGSSFMGSIRAVEIDPEHPVICQKSAFLAATEGVQLSVFFQKKLGSGFFGGEGFIMQKLTGKGIAFIEIDGYGVEYDLKAGEELIADTGYLAMCDQTVSIDIQKVKGLKNIFFGGEGLFNTKLTGPGRVILQTLPLCQVAAALAPYMPSKSSDSDSSSD